MRHHRLLGALLAGTLLLSGCGGASEPEPDAPPAADWQVPCPEPEAGAKQATDFTDLTLPCLGSDGEYEVGAITSQPMVITLWASWCKPCADEAPALREFHDRLGEQVMVLGVDTQDTSDKGRYFAEDFGWQFPSVFDERGEVLHSQGLTALPATFFISTEGDTVAEFTDGSLTVEELMAAAQDHFGVTP